MTDHSPGPPLDPDVDLGVAAQRDELAAGHGAVLGVIAVGGAIGSLARYGAAAAWPHAVSAFPWATLLVNVSGCLLLGALMATLELRRAHRLVRPFVGTGVLGGFTTFSTAMVDARLAVGAAAAGLAAVYVAATLLGAIGAVRAGAVLARRALTVGSDS